MTALWQGLGLFWFNSVLIIWWAILCPGSTKAGHYFWLSVNIALASCGFICMIAFARSKNEGLSAGLSVMWIVSGIVGAIMSACWLIVAAKCARQPAWLGCWKCCCSAREWTIGFGLLAMLWFFVFSIGFTVQVTFAVMPSTSRRIRDHTRAESDFSKCARVRAHTCMPYRFILQYIASFQSGTHGETSLQASRPK